MPTRRHLSELEATPHVNVFPGMEPKTVRLSLDAGERVPEHEHADRQVVFHLLEGSLELTVGETTVELDAGHVVQFDGARPISVDALVDAEALIVLARKSGAGSERV